MEEKKSFWGKVAELYARFGNPSGGMVHSDMPADKAEKAPEAKAEPKKEKVESKNPTRNRSANCMRRTAIRAAA